jgi:hypothetical protein
MPAMPSSKLFQILTFFADHKVWRKGALRLRRATEVRIFAAIRTTK